MERISGPMIAAGRRKRTQESKWWGFGHRAELGRRDWGQWGCWADPCHSALGAQWCPLWMWLPRVRLVALGLVDHSQRGAVKMSGYPALNDRSPQPSRRDFQTLGTAAGDVPR